MELPEEYRKFLFEIVKDKRYTQESFLQSIEPCAALKEAVLARGFVQKLNDAYGWSFSDDMNPKNAEQILNIAYEIVLKPGYSLEKFLKAIQSGKRL